MNAYLTSTTPAAQHRVGMAAALWILVAFAARASLEATAAGSPWRIPLALAPLPPFLFFLWAVVAAVRSLDELGRRIHLEALAVAFSLATVLLMTLGLLQLAMTLPPEDWSYRHTWSFLPPFYFLGLALAQRRYR